MLDDINVYNKNDGTPNYFVQNDRITIVYYTECLVDGIPSATRQRHTGTLQSIYNDLIPFINTKGTAIVKRGQSNT